MRNFSYLLISLLMLSCGVDDDANRNSVIGNSSENLQTEINRNNVAYGNVIACSASSTTVANGFEVYFYPRPNSSNNQYWVSESANINPNNFSNYKEKETNTRPLFNGYLQAFLDTSNAEKWVIASFKENDSLHLSNPIRIKHLEQPTLFSDAVDITEDIMPTFNWDAPTNAETAIYFEVVSNSDNNLLSGTYTFDTNFQYYNLDNVVLNVTRETPPNLIEANDYFFTMMAVSEDNWVNLLLEKSFQP